MLATVNIRLEHIIVHCRFSSFPQPKQKKKLETAKTQTQTRFVRRKTGQLSEVEEGGELKMDEKYLLGLVVLAA